MNTAKRHSIYRVHRSWLQSVVPGDAWRDEEKGVDMVIFLMDRGHLLERQLAFAVHTDSLEVVAAAILVLRVSLEGWTIQTLAARD